MFTNLDALMKEAGVQLKRKRFMLVGTHAHQTTGYSKVCYHLIQELSKHADVFHFGFQKFVVSPPEYRPYPPNVNVYDPVEKERDQSATQEMGFGFKQLPDYVRKVKPDVLMVYNDASVVYQFMDSLATLSESEKTYKLYVYLDQVYTIQRPDLLARIEKEVDTYFVFTPYWKSMLEGQGVMKPIHVLRHGFDPRQFVQGDRLALRKKHSIPEGSIVLLNMNRNTPRKRHDIVVTAFAELVARFPTKPLLLMAVCDNGETGGFPLQEIYYRELDRLGVQIQPNAQKLVITKSAMTHTDELVNDLYCMSDIGITAADGEGFGLCQFEAMGLGIPQVVPLIGGFRDFCQGGVNSQTVPPVYRSYLATSQSAVGGMIEVVDPHALALAAEEYILDSDLRLAHGAKARETVLAYKWENELKPLVDLL